MKPLSRPLPFRPLHIAGAVMVGLVALVLSGFAILFLGALALGIVTVAALSRLRDRASGHGRRRPETGSGNHWFDAHQEQAHADLSRRQSQFDSFAARRRAAEDAEIYESFRADAPEDAQQSRSHT